MRPIPLIPLLAVLLFSSPLCAQVYFSNGIDLRLEGGITYSQARTIIPTAKPSVFINGKPVESPKYNRNKKSQDFYTLPTFGAYAVFNSKNVVRQVVGLSFSQFKSNYDYYETGFYSNGNEMVTDTSGVQTVTNLVKRYSGSTTWSFINLCGGLEFKVVKGLNLGFGAQMGLRLAGNEVSDGTHTFETNHKGYTYNTVTDVTTQINYNTDSTVSVSNIHRSPVRPAGIFNFYTRIAYQYKIDNVSFGIYAAGMYRVGSPLPYLSAGLIFSPINHSNDDE